jgi:two-component system LytT family sensor kinase
MPDTEEKAGPGRLTGREIALIVAFWTFLAIVITANRLTDPRAREGAPVSGPIVLTLIEAYLWAALTPLIFWLARRFGPGRRNWPWRLALLVASGIALALLVAVATSFVRTDFLDLPRRARPGPVPLVDRFLFLNDFTIYLGVVAAGLAREYFRRYEARKEEAAALRAQLAESQLATLRMQLNPHFLFNTLHAVSALVERDPEGVRRMIARLSELLRSTLEEGLEPERTLDRELAFISRYLEIMQVRFQGRLVFEVDADRDVREALVPTLILQPVVENAVMHGIANVRAGGRIVVRARREGGHLVLSVRDTGAGPPPPDAWRAGRGVGLRNTEARLRGMYGDDQSLLLMAAEGGGTVAEIRIPHRRAAADARAAEAGRE